MEPTGKDPLPVIRSRLKIQKDECLKLLKLLDHGVGRLVAVSMSVNELGKIDLNQWTFFIVQHARRHLDQLDSVSHQFPSD